MIKRFFNYIFSRSNTAIFFSAFILSASLTGSFLYLVFEQPNLLIKDLNDPHFSIWNLTLLGKFYMISGIFPNFLFLLLIFRLIKFLFIISLKIIGRIIIIIFSNENLDKFNDYITKLEKAYKKNKPKMAKVVNKIKSKKKIQKDYLIPISMIISATIIALAILFK